MGLESAAASGQLMGPGASRTGSACFGEAVRRLFRRLGLFLLRRFFRFRRRHLGNRSGRLLIGRRQAIQGHRRRDQRRPRHTGRDAGRLLRGEAGGQHELRGLIDRRQAMRRLFGANDRRRRRFGRSSRFGGGQPYVGVTSDGVGETGPSLTRRTQTTASANKIATTPHGIARKIRSIVFPCQSSLVVTDYRRPDAW